jgi:hypothetical protein
MSKHPNSNRFAYLERTTVLFLEGIGFCYVGCEPTPLEEGEVYLIQIYRDWQIQVEPYFSVTHTPTGHCWMLWDDAPEDADFIKRIIRAGTQVQLAIAWEESCKRP